VPFSRVAAPGEEKGEVYENVEAFLDVARKRIFVIRQRLCCEHHQEIASFV
jgi:hypothetical protein